MNKRFEDYASNHRLVVLGMCTLLLLLLCGYFWRLLTGQSTFFIADHAYYFEPFANFIGAALAANKLPLWNPYLYAGMPQAAVPSPGMFYPFTIFFAYMSYSQALSLTLMINQILIAVGSFLLIYSLGWGVSAATVAGITLSLCGYMFSIPNNYTLMAGAAPFPLMLWSYRRIGADLKNRRPYFACAIAIVATYMCVSAGRPELFVPAILLTIMLMFYDACKNKKHGLAIAPPLVWQFTALVSALLLTMPIVLPVIEWVMQSPRAKGLNLSQTFMWSVNWYDLVDVIFAYPFGDLQILGAHHLNLVATRPVYLPFVPSNYIGPFVMTAAIWGISDSSWKQRKLLLLYAVCVLILCLGEYTPITPALFQFFPALTTFRFPIKWMIFFIFALVVAAARGIYRLCRFEISKSGRIAAVSFWCLSLVATTLFLGLYFTKKSLIGTTPPLPVEAELWLGQSFLIGAIIGFSACGLEWLKKIQRITAVQTSLIFTACVLLNLFIPACRFQQLTVSPNFFSKNSFVLDNLRIAKKELLKDNPKAMDGEGRFLSLYFDPFWTPPYYRSKYDPRWTPAFFDYARNLLLPNTNVDLKVPETFGYEAAETGPYRKLFFDILHQCSVCLPGTRPTDRQASSQHYSDLPLLNFCRCTATSWIGTQVRKGPKDVAKLDDRYFKLSQEDKYKNVRLYKVKLQLPRAYLSQYWRWCDGQEEIMEKIRDADSSHFNPAVMSLIERNAISGISDIRGTDRSFGAALPGPPNSSPALPPDVGHSSFADKDPLIDACPVTILTDEAEHLSMSVKVDRPCFLILSDHFYPGWQASIDGAKRPCYRCNAEGRAVFIPTGAHLIEFNYFPESLRLGLQLAAVGALVLLLLLLAGLRPYVWRFIKFLAGE